MNKSIGLLILFLALGAGAQEKKASKEGAGNSLKRISVDMEAESVEGAAPSPELEFIFQKKNFNYRRMIKLRKNFIPEAEKAREYIIETP